MNFLASVCGNSVGSGILANLLTYLLSALSVPLLGMLLAWWRGRSGSTSNTTSPTVPAPTPAVTWPLLGSFMLYVFGLAILMVGLPEIGMGGEQWINLFVATIVVNPLFLVVSVSLPRIGSWTRRLLGNTKADNVAGGLVLNWLGNVFTIAAGAVALSIILGIAKIFNV